MYSKLFRQEINAKVCRVKYQSEQWHCGFEDDSNMDAHHAGINFDLIVTASQCRTLAIVGSVTLKDETLEFKKGIRTTAVKQNNFAEKGADVSDNYRNECCDSFGWVNRKTFEGHVQDVTLELRTKDGKVMIKDRLQLPRPLEELACGTFFLDPYAYTWKVSYNCILAAHRKEDVNMINQGKNNYYIVSGRKNTSQYPFEVKPKPQTFGNKPVQVNPTNYDSFYVVIDFGGFDLASGKRI